ncbi:hypothetical protein GCM10023238_39390 [Streptomyces heliomycini]
MPDAVPAPLGERLATPAARSPRLPYYDGPRRPPRPARSCSTTGLFDAELSTGLERARRLRTGRVPVSTCSSPRTRAASRGGRGAGTSPDRGQGPARDDRFRQTSVDRLVRSLADTLPLLCEVDG